MGRTFLNMHTNDQREFNLNQTLLQFYQLLEKSFDIRRTQERAQTNLAVLKQKTGDLENYIINFNALASKAGFILLGSTENPMLPPAFLKGLSPTLRKKIIEQKEPPKMLKGIIDDARKYEQSYYQSLQWKDEITRWQLTCSLPHTPIHPAYTSKPRDPETMDIDRLSINERNDYMKKESCFQCGQTGHMSCDHVTNPSLNTGKGNTSNFRKPTIRQPHLQTKEVMLLRKFMPLWQNSMTKI